MAHGLKQRGLAIVEWLIVLAIFGIIAAVVSSAFGVNEKSKFMDECKRERKDYECVAMWRSGDKPVPIIITR